METLTKENFWDDICLKYPKASVHFKEWIDKYKKDNNWLELFWEGDSAEDNSYYHHAPKYHELPIAMQYGIFIEYIYHLRDLYEVSVVMIETGTIPFKEDFIQSIKNIFNNHETYLK